MKSLCKRDEELISIITVNPKVAKECGIQSHTIAARPDSVTHKCQHLRLDVRILLHIQTLVEKHLAAAQKGTAQKGTSLIIGCCSRPTGAATRILKAQAFGCPLHPLLGSKRAAAVDARSYSLQLLIVQCP
jgi:hypothetical protein